MAPSELFGTFSEPGTLAAGDKYIDKADTQREQPKKQLKPFIVTPPRTGKVDGLLDKTVRSLGEGDVYVDAWLLERRINKAAGKPPTNKPFYMLAAPRASMSCGPGSNDGCLTAVPLDTDSSAAAMRSNPPRSAADKKKNFFTTGPKKGGFGQPWKDRCLGDPPKYYCDVYEGGREKEKEMRAAMKKLAKPFVSGACPNRAFNKDAEAFTAAAPPAAGGTSSSGRRGSGGGGEGGKPKPATVWRPGGPPKKGAAYCPLSQVGRDHIPDPVPEAKFQAKKGGPAPFKPIGATKHRLSMWAPNPFLTEARPAKNQDYTLFDN